MNIHLIILSLFVPILAFSQTTNPLKQELRVELEEFSENDDRMYNAGVGYTLMGRRFDDPFVNSRWGRSIIEANIGMKYEDWFKARLSAVQIFTSGAVGYQLGVTEAGATNGLFLDEASVSIMPNDWLEGSAGVLSISYNPIMSFFGGAAQTGGMISFDHKNDNGLKLSFDVSQTIPTSIAKGNIITDEGTNPLLTLATAYIDFKNEPTGSRARASVTHFEYTDLSTATASDSFRTGSTVAGGTNFQFVHEFRGKELALGFEQELGISHELKLKGSIINNERAPEELRDGEQVKLEFERKFNKWSLIPSVTRFRIEGDALPSSYSVSSYGYTNRDGYSVAMKAEVPKLNFNLFASYTNATAINKDGENLTVSQNSTYQADREIFTLGAEVTYDIF